MLTNTPSVMNAPVAASSVPKEVINAQDTIETWTPSSTTRQRMLKQKQSDLKQRQLQLGMYEMHATHEKRIYRSWPARVHK